jgi:hypothetical protein
MALPQCDSRGYPLINPSEFEIIGDNFAGITPEQYHTYNAGKYMDKIEQALDPPISAATLAKLTKDKDVEFVEKVGT